MNEWLSKKPINKNENHGERRENTVEDLFVLTRAIAKEVNAHVKEKYKTEHNLVNDTGAISMGFFAREQGGIYTPEEIGNDKALIEDLESKWSGARDPNIQRVYKEQYSVEGEKNIAKKYMKMKERDKNGQMEMLTNAVFYKILKERFIVVRASTYDDYVGGVDNYLVDKETGDIVCAFDEVHDYAAKGDRKEEKWKRVESIGRGGKKIKYGVVPQGDKLTQKEIRNVPIFFLSLTTEELERGMRSFSKELDSTPNEYEQKIFNKYILLLQEEYDRIKDMEMPRPTRENLEKFRRALETMKDIGVNKNMG